MSRSFWNNRKVLVTGADGFIGSHLVERLAREGANVRAFTHYNSFNDWGWLEEIDNSLKESIEIYPGDIRDYNRVFNAVSGQEIIFHLASLIAIPYSYDATESYIQTNIYGTLNILNACKKLQVKHILHTSTSEVYGTAQYVPIDEKHPLQGQSPYSASKIGADMLAESFYRSFGLPVSIVRPFNTYGPRQSSRAVIPTILSQIHMGVSELKLGSLHPTRDFNFVQDTVSGFLAIAETEKVIGKVANIGSGRDISIGELVDLLMQITGKKVKVICEAERIRPDKSEVNRLLCNSSFLQNATGWRSEFTLENGLGITSEWIKRNPHYFKTTMYNR